MPRFLVLCSMLSTLRSLLPAFHSLRYALCPMLYALSPLASRLKYRVARYAPPTSSQRPPTGYFPSCFSSRLSIKGEEVFQRGRKPFEPDNPKRQRAAAGKDFHGHKKTEPLSATHQCPLPGRRSPVRIFLPDRKTYHFSISIRYRIGPAGQQVRASDPCPPDLWRIEFPGGPGDVHQNMNSFWLALFGCLKRLLFLQYCINNAPMI
jgi:hypothetical protein